MQGGESFMLENLLVEKHLSARLLSYWTLFLHYTTHSTQSPHCFCCGSDQNIPVCLSSLDAQDIKDARDRMVLAHHRISSQHKVYMKNWKEQKWSFKNHCRSSLSLKMHWRIFRTWKTFGTVPPLSCLHYKSALKFLQSRC